MPFNNISNRIIDGMQMLKSSGNFNDETLKQILPALIDVVINEQKFPNSMLVGSKSDQMKELIACCLLLYIEAARNQASGDDLDNFIQNTVKLKSSTANVLSHVYDQHKHSLFDRLEGNALQITSLTNVHWRFDLTYLESERPTNQVTAVFRLTTLVKRLSPQQHQNIFKKIHINFDLIDLHEFAVILKAILHGFERHQHSIRN